MYQNMSAAELNGLFGFVGKAAKKVGKAAGKAAPYALATGASFATGNPMIAANFLASKASGQGTKLSLSNAFQTPYTGYPPQAGSPGTEPIPRYGSNYMPIDPSTIGKSNQLPNWLIPAMIAGGLVVTATMMRR